MLDGMRRRLGDLVAGPSPSDEELALAYAPDGRPDPLFLLAASDRDLRRVARLVRAGKLPPLVGPLDPVEVADALTIALSLGAGDVDAHPAPSADEQRTDAPRASSAAPGTTEPAGQGSEASAPWWRFWERWER